MASETPAPDPASSPKFKNFTITDVDYKQIGGTSVLVSILAHKALKPGKRPVIVRWHGGCLMTGNRIFDEWFTSWLLAFTERSGAILLSPDYRLLPEAGSAAAILEDTSDFYSWLFASGKLAEQLPSGVEADLDDVLVVGESAGGYLAVQSALVHGDKFRAVIAQYPMIDMRDPHYSAEVPGKKIMEIPRLPSKILNDYMAKLKGDEVVTGRLPPEGFAFISISMYEGRYTELFGSDPALFPIEVLDSVKSVPPIWILHGNEDTMVPIEGTDKFIEKLKQKLPDAVVRLDTRPGEHAFDKDVTLEDDWMKDGVAFVSKYWGTA